MTNQSKECKLKIAVGVSGGVDSSVAAYLLKQTGAQVIGMFMRNWDEQSDICPAAADYEDAKSVCLKLGIPFYAVDFSEEYRQSVFSHFLSEYEKGRTPNPDILCNSKIKFDVFSDYAINKLQCDAIATGHYAKVDNSFSPNGVFDPYCEFDPKHTVRLYKAKDKNKDQSYFLSALKPAQLERAIFPLADIEKPRVRQIAEELGLRTAKKKDSTGICFIGERNFRKFLSEYLKGAEGDMIDADTGKKLGEHIGLMHYTIGQRRGLDIGGCGSGERWFVVEKDVEKNILYVVQGADNPKNFFCGFTSSELSFINPPKQKRMKLKLKYRYRQEDIACSAEFNDSLTACTVRFDIPDRGVAPGQSGVFYDGEELIGSAVIEQAIKN